MDFAINNKSRIWKVSSHHLYLYQTVSDREIQNDYLIRNFLTYRINDKWDILSSKSQEL